MFDSGLEQFKKGNELACKNFIENKHQLIRNRLKQLEASYISFLANIIDNRFTIRTIQAYFTSFNFQNLFAKNGLKEEQGNTNCNSDVSHKMLLMLVKSL